MQYGHLVDTGLVKLQHARLVHNIFRIGLAVELLHLRGHLRGVVTANKPDGALLRVRVIDHALILVPLKICLRGVKPFRRRIHLGQNRVQRFDVASSLCRLMLRVDCRD